MVEMVERKAEVAQPLEGAQLLGQFIQVVTIQKESLQTKRTHFVQTKYHLVCTVHDFTGNAHKHGASSRGQQQLTGPTGHFRNLQPRVPLEFSSN